MKIELVLSGPDVELTVDGEDVQLSSHGNVVKLRREHLPLLVSQLELLMQMLDVAAEAAPSATSSGDGSPEPLRRRLERYRHVRGTRPPQVAPEATPAAAATPAAPEPAPAPKPAPSPPRRTSRRSGGRRPQVRLFDLILGYLREQGPKTREEIVEYVKAQNLSTAKNVASAVAIALGRGKTRFHQLDDGRYAAASD